MPQSRILPMGPDPTPLARVALDIRSSTADSADSAPSKIGATWKDSSSRPRRGARMWRSGVEVSVPSEVEVEVEMSRVLQLQRASSRSFTARQVSLTAVSTYGRVEEVGEGWLHMVVVVGVYKSLLSGTTAVARRLCSQINPEIAAAPLVNLGSLRVHLSLSDY